MTRPPDPADSAEPAPAESAPAASESAPAASPPASPPAGNGRSGAAVRAWRGWRRWRRSRPFWAGLLLLIAGAELLLIPLPLNSLGLIVHVGFGGIAGILIGSVLIVCALLLWFSPAQRTFYSIVAVLLSIAALIASNLGGFFLGTLLGVIGGSLGVRLDAGSAAPVPLPGLAAPPSPACQPAGRTGPDPGAPGTRHRRTPAGRTPRAAGPHRRLGDLARRGTQPASGRSGRSCG
jgi:hypothetical protein